MIENTDMKMKTCQKTCIRLIYTVNSIPKIVCRNLLS